VQGFFLDVHGRHLNPKHMAHVPQIKKPTKSSDMYNSPSFYLTHMKKFTWCISQIFTGTTRHPTLSNHIQFQVKE